MAKKGLDKFLHRHIKKHMEELGMNHDQAVAVALEEARAKGYDVSPNPDGTRSMEKMK